MKQLSKSFLTLILVIIILSAFGQKNTISIKSYSVFQYDLVNPSDSILIFFKSLDENGNKLSEINYEQGSLFKEQTWKYDAENRLISHVTKHQNETNTVLKIYYNENGQIIKEVNQSIVNSNIYSDTISYLYKKNNLIRESRNCSHHKESNDYFTIYHYNKNNSLIEKIGYKSDSTILIKEFFKYSEKGKILNYYYFNPDATLLGDTTIGMTYKYDTNDSLIKTIERKKFTHIRNNTTQITTCIIKYENNKKIEEVTYFADTCITSIKKYNTNGNILKELFFWYCDTNKIEYEKDYKNGVLISDIQYHSDGGINRKKLYNEFGSLIESIEYIFEINGQGAIRYLYYYDKHNRFTKQLYFVKKLPKDANWDKISSVTSEWKNEKPISSQEHFYNINGDKEKIVFFDSDNKIVKTQLIYYKYY